MGGSVVLPREKTEQKIAEYLAQGRISKNVAKRWWQTVELLRLVDNRQGLNLDILATKPAFQNLFKSLAKKAEYQGDFEKINQAVSYIVIRTLYDLADAGIIRSGNSFFSLVKA